MEISLRPTATLLRLTDEEFFEFCQLNRDVRLERTAHGKIIVMPPTGALTGAYNSEIVYRLKHWNHQHQLGVVFDSSTGFKLPNGAVRSPDAAWLVADRWAALSDNQRRAFPPLIPDFIVELMSETDDLLPAQEKMAEWLGNGARLGWLLYPQQQRAFVYRPDALVAEAGFSDVLSGQDVLPGFTLDLRLLRQP